MRKTVAPCMQIIIKRRRLLKEEIDLKDLGKSFQSEGALNLKALLPLSLAIFGTEKNR